MIIECGKSDVCKYVYVNYWFVFLFWLMICRVFSFFIVVDEDDEEVFIGSIGFIEKCVVIVVLEIVFF